MNNPCSTSKKDNHHQSSATHHLININSPANIIKKARESLQKPSSQKPASHQGFKRPNPQLKVLSQASSNFDEIKSPKALPPFKEDPKTFKSPISHNRAKSAYGTRGILIDDNFMMRGPGATHDGKSKNIFSGDVDPMAMIDTIENNSGQKPHKTFIIKHKHKKGEKNEKAQTLPMPRKTSMGSFDNNDHPTITITKTTTGPLSAGQSPTNFRITHNLPKFSSFKIEPSLRDVQNLVIEEKKSESDGTNRTLGNSGLGNSAVSKFNISQVNSRGDVTEFMPGSGEIAQSVIIKDNNSQVDSKRETQVLKRDSQIHVNVKLGEELGEGAYGVVHKALNIETGQFLAVKHIRVDELQNKSSIGLENFCHEIEVYQKLEHGHIVPYIGAKQDGQDIYIYMEYMPGGSISSMLKQYGFFEEKVLKKFTKQVVLGLHYLHGKGVIHRDIKGGNILSDGTGNVKLADFGASKHIENISFVSAVTNSEVCHSIKGSLYWMAPELLNQEKHGRKIDIWSLGCTVIEMATGKHPWPDVKSFPEFVVAMMTYKCPPIPEHLSDIAKDFILQCCQYDKKMRPKTEALLQHPFLADDE